MVYKYLVAALYATGTLAQDDEGPEAKKYSHIVKMVFNQITTTHTSKAVSKMLQNYGCHCFPGNSRIAGGAGPPQDDYDDLCKRLARCHKCIEMDYGISDFNAEWNDDIGKYRWDADGNGDISCAANTDPYKMDLCLCDSQYAMDLGNVWDDNTFDMSIWGNRKNSLYTLDYDNVCEGVLGGPKACCGNYPWRYPYNSGTMDCCEGETVYNSVNSECCDDGSIASTGAC